MIDRSVIAEILAKSDIVALIGGHVALRRQGQHFIGLCPFHSERSPSFHVRQDRAFFKCFGCGVGGDAIRFIERIENLSFLEAARFLAKRVGVEVERETAFSSKAREQRDAIYAANALATDFFAKRLAHAPDAHVAREYCRSRGIDAAAIERFRLGYAPHSWNALRDELRQAGITDDVSLQAGLLKDGQRGLYDVYRHRLIIPTTTVTGEIVAFGGRALEGEEPKYLNTSTTPVYSKGKLVFGLAQARRAVGTTGAFIVVEGYLDCIALHRAGFEHAVASLGTAFTAEQAALLKRFTTNVYVAFDADRAGQEAMLKSLEILKVAGCKARVVDLPSGEDPDSVVQKGGPAAFAALLSASREATLVLIDEKLRQLNDGFHTQTEKVEAAEKIVRDEPRADWDRWRLHVAETLNIPVDDLRRAIGPVALHRSFAVGNPTEAVRQRSLALPSRERDLLTILLEEPTLFAEYRNRISPHRIRDRRLNRLYMQLCAAEQLETGIDVLMAANGDELASEALLYLTTQERSSAIRFANSEERRQALDGIVASFTREDDERRRRVLSEQIDDYLNRGATVPAELLAQHHAVESRLVKVVRNTN